MISDRIYTHEEAKIIAQYALENLTMEPRQERNQAFEPDTHVIVDRDGGTVAVGIHVQVLGYEVVETGSAKLHPKDTFNRDVGIALATARAYRRMAGQLERLANEYVDQKDTYRTSTNWTINYPFGGER